MAVLAEQPVHGYLIIQRLSGMDMFRCQAPDPTGVYRVLRSMEEGGLVVSTWDFGDSGPAKRRFELTADGRTCFARWTQTIEQYSLAINDLLAVMKHSAGIRPPG